LNDRPEKIFFAGEVAVDGAIGNTRPFSDGIHGRREDAVREEQRLGRIENGISKSLVFRSTTFLGKKFKQRIESTLVFCTELIQ
jgi:hypothetical protein